MGDKGRKSNTPGYHKWLAFKASFFFFLTLSHKELKILSSILYLPYIRDEISPYPFSAIQYFLTLSKTYMLIFYEDLIWFLMLPVSSCFDFCLYFYELL